MDKVDRFLSDVSNEELREAVAEMCRKLRIPGSVVDEYSLYNAVFGEKDRAIEKKKLWESLA